MNTACDKHFNFIRKPLVVDIFGVGMGRFFSFLMLQLVKMTSSLFYRYEENWLNIKKEQVNWSEIRLIVFLNHTSLFEPIFLRVAPSNFLWMISRKLVVPGADITLQRPILGRFFKFLIPGAIPITRKKDESWQKFLAHIKPSSLVAILPEGRMKRSSGFDKDGLPMSVRGGIADILKLIDDGKALFVYSGGLHHIQTPGQKLPKLFQRVKVNLEVLNISSYKAGLKEKSFKAFKANIISDLNFRLKNSVPKD